MLDIGHCPLQSLFSIVVNLHSSSTGGKISRHSQQIFSCHHYSLASTLTFTKNVTFATRWAPWKHEHPQILKLINTGTWESLIRKWNNFLDNEMGRKLKLLDYVKTQWFWVGRVSSYYLGGSIVSIGVVKERYKTRDYDVAHLKLVKQVKPLQNSTWPYRNEIPPHYFHEIERKGYDVIGVNVFPREKWCY